jgi:hypothetical protein
MFLPQGGPSRTARQQCSWADWANHIIVPAASAAAHRHPPLDCMVKACCVDEPLILKHCIQHRGPRRKGALQRGLVGIVDTSSLQRQCRGRQLGGGERARQGCGHADQAQQQQAPGLVLHVGGHLTCCCRPASTQLHTCPRTPSQLEASSSGESAQNRSAVTPSVGGDGNSRPRDIVAELSAPPAVTSHTTRHSASLPCRSPRATPRGGLKMKRGTEASPRARAAQTRS